MRERAGSKDTDGCGKTMLQNVFETGDQTILIILVDPKYTTILIFL